MPLELRGGQTLDTTLLGGIGTLVSCCVPSQAGAYEFAMLKIIIMGSCPAPKSEIYKI
ncbi:hypothetical protein DAPPUDRAFT_244743 [Daphnia pulex]|uniref:Uncharacterized protein n=1 Tax=Daphnia pulex TaxID=6669 RepID=E9GLQ0_DAPPU|nr:hypothetical protein DAPPUDRAFT_244743 [Daphnia pulex]|eukprot:EFX79644.1 hypothetical protein DAPPUDRAFT_244743 [Daphnia pulex]